MGEEKQRWENAYSTRPPSGFPWEQERASPSIEWILEYLPYRKVRILDVGSGTSALVDQLLLENYFRPTLLDHSECALATTRERLGGRQDGVNWIAQDVRELRPSTPFALWHDRGLYSVLPSAAARREYVGVLWRSLFPGGLALIATLGEATPAELAGFSVCPFDTGALAVELGPEFRLRLARIVWHKIPSGGKLPFHYSLFEKT